jgi:hypothetical protein
MLRHAQLDAGVPTGAIEHQHDLLAGTGSRLARKRGELDFKDGDADGGGQMKERP